MHFYIQTIVGSLAFGSVYALVALGVVFIWQSMNILNFAHGQFLTLGTYIAVVTLHQGMDWPLWLAILAALGFVGLLGALFSKTVYERIRAQPSLVVIIATMGLSLIMENSALLIFGPRPRAFAGFFGRAMIWVGKVGFLGNHLIALGIAILILAILSMLMKYTMVGKIIRAVAYDKDTAGLMGVPVFRFLACTFAVACILAVIAGILVAPVTYISIDMGTGIGTKAFAAMVIGGFGSIPGAIVGSYLLGLLEGLGTIVVGSVYRDAIAFVLAVLVLLLRPYGLFGSPEKARV